MLECLQCGHYSHQHSYCQNVLVNAFQQQRQQHCCPSTLQLYIIKNYDPGATASGTTFTWNSVQILCLNVQFRHDQGRCLFSNQQVLVQAVHACHNLHRRDSILRLSFVMTLCGPSAFVMYVPDVSSETFAFIFKEGLSILEAEGKMFLRNVGKHLPTDTTPTIPESKRHFYKCTCLTCLRVTRYLWLFPLYKNMGSNQDRYCGICSGHTVRRYVRLHLCYIS
jgi:hypothetical protein